MPKSNSMRARSTASHFRSAPPTTAKRRIVIGNGFSRCSHAGLGKNASQIWEDDMALEGGCYCGAVRYQAEGKPQLKAQCHCRECQYITGGSPNMFLLMPPDGFRYTKGAPKQFTRSDIENPVTREFCAECGTHLATR